MKKKSNPIEVPDRFKRELASADMTPIRGSAHFKHSVNIGDLYAAMGAMKEFYDSTGRKVILFQSTNTKAAYYPGASHPTVNSVGENVCMNEPMFEMVKPLVESQEYIDSMHPYNGQQIHVDLDVIRGKTKVNLPHGAIQGWISLAIPDLAFDMTKPWITLDKKTCPPHIRKQAKGKIILNFTERYRNTFIDYFFLKKFMPELAFIGTEKEYWLFCNQWQLSIPRIEVANFLELGHVLQESRFLLSNQSQGWNLAEAMKTPRILEICEFAQNCIHMVGKHSYGFLHQGGVEYYVRKMYNIT